MLQKRKEYTYFKPSASYSLDFVFVFMYRGRDTGQKHVSGRQHKKGRQLHKTSVEHMTQILV